jgi:hypothetical protein
LWCWWNPKVEGCSPLILRDSKKSALGSSGVDDRKRPSVALSLELSTVIEPTTACESFAGAPGFPKDGLV